MDLLDDIANKLITDGLVNGATGWKLYKSYLPPSPAQAVAIYEMPGPEPDQTPGTAYEFPGFQIYVRGAEFEYGVAREKIKEIYNSLNNADIPGYTYIYAADSGPLLEGYDKETNRPVLFWSFNTMRGPNPMIISGGAEMTTTPEVPAIAGGSGSFSITIPSAIMGAVGN